MKNGEPIICCFCEKIMRWAQTDAFEIAIRSIGTHSDPELGSQGLYSHFACLRDRVAADITLVGEPLD